MATTLQVVLDCADPGAQAEFWAAALGYVVQPPPPDQRRARVEDEVERLVALGATRPPVLEEMGEHWVVHQDPEGDEFCVS